MKAKLIYAVFGALPAAVLSAGAAYLSYAELHAVITGADAQLSSLLFYVVWPLCGVIGTVCGFLVLCGVGLGNASARLAYLALLCLGIGAALLLSWFLFPSPVALVPLFPVWAGVHLVKLVRHAAQPKLPADLHSTASRFRAGG